MKLLIKHLYHSNEVIIEIVYSWIIHIFRAQDKKFIVHNFGKPKTTPKIYDKSD